MLKVEELEKQVNSGVAEGIYLFYGAETFLLEQQVKKMKKVFGELVKGINYIIIDENSIQELIADIETPAFGYPKKLIIAKNTGIFKREGKGKTGGASKEVKDKIKKEIKRYKKMPPVAAESTMTKNYIETMLEMPWNKVSRDSKSLEKAMEILDKALVKWQENSN